MRSGRASRASLSRASRSGSSPSISATSSVPGLQERLPVSKRGPAADGDDLRLEPVRQHGIHVVPEHVAGLGLDQGRGLHHVPLGRVLGLDALQFLWGALPEHVLEDLIEVAAVSHGSLGGAALVEDRHRGPVLLGLPDAVAVDEVPEDLVRALLGPHQDGRAREADAGAVG